MELKITDRSLLTSYWIILSYLVGEFLMELKITGVVTICEPREPEIPNQI